MRLPALGRWAPPCKPRHDMRPRLPSLIPIGSRGAPMHMGALMEWRAAYDRQIDRAGCDDLGTSRKIPSKSEREAFHWGNRRGASRKVDQFPSPMRPECVSHVLTRFAPPATSV